MNFITRRLTERKARRATRAALENLEDHILLDIGIEDSLRHTLSYNRELSRRRLLAVVNGGLFQ